MKNECLPVLSADFRDLLNENNEIDNNGRMKKKRKAFVICCNKLSSVKNVLPGRPIVFFITGSSGILKD